MRYRQLSSTGASALAIFEFSGTTDEVADLFGIDLTNFNQFRLVQPQQGRLDFDQFLLVKISDSIYEGHFHGGYGVSRALHQFLLDNKWQESRAPLSLISAATSPLALRLLNNGDSASLLSDCWRQRLSSPPRIALVGPPNAGKSTLFNAWLSEQRVTVSEHHGTTRDFVEAPIMLGSGDDALAATLIDTAGLCDFIDASQENDAAAVAMTLQLLDDVDECVWIFDNSSALGPDIDGVLESRKDHDDLMFVNRCDLPASEHISEYQQRAVLLDDIDHKHRCAAIAQALFEKWGAPLPEQLS
ncbi:MAG: 50S ribosome-binding GTPase [Planctomycetota bacterium]|nr:50S ribosome-binding GTPase [Planctomycetota bacterium]